MRFAEGSYLNTPERLNYEIDLRARRLEKDLSVGVAIRATTRLTVELAAAHGEIRFDGDDYFRGQRLKETLDRDTQIYGVTARHRCNGLTTFGLRYENQTDRFPLSPIRDTDSFRVMPGVELRPRALLNGSAWVGYRRFEPKAAALPSQAGLVSQLALSYTLLSATMLRHLRPSSRCSAPSRCTAPHRFGFEATSQTSWPARRERASARASHANGAACAAAREKACWGVRGAKPLG